MAAFFRSLASVLLALALPLAALAQSVGVGTTAPNPAAALDVTSTSQGLLLPRMTAAQRAAIASPPQGLFVFQTDGTIGLYYYAGLAWVNIATGRMPDAAGNADPVLQVSTLAGSGTQGFADGPGPAAQFDTPFGVAVDGSGDVYVADRGNNRIRKIVAATGVVSTLASGFTSPTGVAVDGSGDVYVVGILNSRIHKITVATGGVSTLAGSGLLGFADGPGPAARFDDPLGVAVDGSGTMYVADRDNHRIRVIKP